MTVEFIERCGIENADYVAGETVAFDESYDDVLSGLIDAGVARKSRKKAARGHADLRLPEETPDEAVSPENLEA